MIAYKKRNALKGKGEGALYSSCYLCCLNLFPCCFSSDVSPIDGVGRREPSRKNTAQIYFE